MSGAGFQKDHREKIELVRACDEERISMMANTY